VNKISKSITLGRLGFITRTFLFVVFLAGISHALVRVGDKVVMQHHIHNNNVIIKASTYVIVGSWTGVILGFFAFAPLFGKIVNPKYSGIEIKNFPMHKYALITGGITAATTFVGFFVVDKVSPGVSAALLSISIFINMHHDHKKGQLDSRKFTSTAIIGVSGIMLILISSSPIKVALWVLGIHILIALFNAYTEDWEQDGARSTDSVNFHLWRMFYLALIGSIGVIILAIYQNNLVELFNQIRELAWSWGAFWVTFVTLFLFFGISLYFEIKARVGQSITTASLIMKGISIVTATAITFVLDFFYPNILGELDIPRWGIYTWIVGIFLLIYCFHKMKKNELT
jgi:hypothetical protein